MKNAPNLFLVGAAKSGTTALWAILNQHPQVFMSTYKEPFFLCEDPILTHKEYENLFAGAGGFSVRGEATTGYLFDKTSPQKIHEICPEAKIIIILRNPVDMSYSYWKYMQANGNEKRSFHNALTEDCPPNSAPLTNRPSSYKYQSRAKYEPQLKRYLSTFRPENVKVVIYDDYLQNVSSEIRSIFRFLGVNEEVSVINKKVNISAETKSKIVQKFTHKRFPLLKKLFPPLWRNFLRQTAKSINQRESKGSVLTSSEKSKYWLLFENDIKDLAKLLNKPELVERWRY